MDILERIRNGVVFLDGGMGTLLQARGLKPGERPEPWVCSRPEAVKEIHRSYYDAGSNVITTNTFGANTLHFSGDELREIVFAAVKLVREAAAESAVPGEKYVALDVGPTGRLLRPLGDLGFEDAVAIFAETVRLGTEAGADLILIETMNDSQETKAALLAAKENSSLPVFVSNAYGADGKLMTGADPAAMIALLEGMGADAVGLNCSLGPAALAPLAEEYLRLASVPVLFMPNAGLPVIRGGVTEYDVGPEEFAERVDELIGKGVRIAGGCCGTTPDYIRALTKRAAGRKALPIREKKLTWVSSGTHAVIFDGRPRIIGERINPTGKKKVKEALRNGDLAFLQGEAVLQQEQGADVLDVNAGLPEIREAEVLPRLVEEIQSVTDLPLQIDTGDSAAMEAALRVCRGKAVLNSVNGKEESMAAVFPLAKKYGGVVVALTLDEAGIPATAEGRVEIAERILARAGEYGLGREDLLVDPLTLTVSADPNAAMVTLEAVRRLTEKGFRTVLGVSNVSFGLPARQLMNNTFMDMAMEAGLSAAIVNPGAAERKRHPAAERALRGEDPGFAEYILAAGDAAAAVSAAEEPSLERAVRRGLAEEAEAFARRLLETVPPIEIIEREIMPALNRVGEDFQKHIVFLPQLLMSAEAAGRAFDVIRAAVPAGQERADLSPVILATVRGDVHDIGKNIVRLLLENYGFPVLDLGKDVPPEKVLAAARESRSALVGLSALMTTTVPAMEETISLLKRELPGVRTVVGGAVLTEEYAASIGADRYAADAMDTVRYAGEVLGET